MDLALILDPLALSPANLLSYGPGADIRQSLLKDGHRTWGFVIYRCTYSSTTQWDEFMSRLRFRIHESLNSAYTNAADLIPSLALTVIENEALLDDCDTSVVRDEFSKWIADGAPTREQGQVGEKIRGKDRDGDEVFEWESQRYLFCVQVDAEVLRSVVQWALPPPEIDAQSEGFLKIVARYWEPRGKGEGGKNNDGRPPMEEIEGCTEFDVGWMMVNYITFVEMYANLRNRDDWYIQYRRPPFVLDGCN